MKNMTREQFQKRQWRFNDRLMEMFSQQISKEIDRQILEEMTKSASKYPFYAKHDPLSIRGMEDKEKL